MIIIIALLLIYTTTLQGKNIIHLREAPQDERRGGAVVMWFVRDTLKIQRQDCLMMKLPLVLPISAH